MSYDETLPTEKDRARALLGDTAAPELLTDAHINAVLDLYGYTGALSFLARELDKHFALQPSDVRLPSGLSVSYARRTWKDLIAAAGGGIGPSGAFSVVPSRSDGYADLAAADV